MGQPRDRRRQSAKTPQLVVQRSSSSVRTAPVLDPTATAVALVGGWTAIGTSATHQEATHQRPHTKGRSHQRRTHRRTGKGHTRTPPTPTRYTKNRPAHRGAVTGRRRGCGARTSGLGGPAPLDADDADDPFQVVNRRELDDNLAFAAADVEPHPRIEPIREPVRQVGERGGVWFRPALGGGRLLCRAVVYGERDEFFRRPH